MNRLIIASLLVASTVFAQTGKKPDRPRTQSITFEEDLLTGEREVGLGEVYGAPVRPGGWKSLIKVRTNFDDKLAESVHEM